MRGSKVDRMGDTALSGQDGRWTKVFRSRTFQLQTTVKPLALSTYKLPNRRNGPEHVTSPEPPPTVNSQPPHIPTRYRLGDAPVARNLSKVDEQREQLNDCQSSRCCQHRPARSRFHITPQRAWPAPWPRLPARAWFALPHHSSTSMACAVASSARSRFPDSVRWKANLASK